MKKLLLLAMVTLFAVSYASADWKTYYVIEQIGQEYPSQSYFKIDWEKKLFFLDSDSEDETKCPMRNIKENGSKKTFAVYYTPSVGGGLYCNCEFNSDADGKMTLVQSMKNDRGGIMKLTYILSDKKPLKDAMRDARKDPKELLKGGIEKASNLFKKKDKKEK